MIEGILAILMVIVGIALLIVVTAVSLAVGIAFGAVSGIYYGIKFCVVSIYDKVRSKFMKGVLYSDLIIGFLAPLGYLIYVIVMMFI